MDQILDIQLLMDGCHLTAIDHTIPPIGSEIVYSTQYVGVEFVANNEGSIEAVVVTDADNNNKVTKFELKKDGRYSYYKIAVPTIDYFIGKNATSIVGEIFYNEGELLQIKTLPIESTFDAIMEVSEIVDCLHSYEAILNKVSSSEEANEAYIFPKKDIFNICNLRKCLVYLQRKMLLEKCSSDKCNSKQSDTERVNFLLSAVYVLEFLIRTNNFAEAQRIIDNISSCGFTCEDTVLTFNDCGCGHSI